MGMTVSVYRSADNHGMFSGDCTNGGLSSKVNRLTLVNVPGSHTPSPDAPPAILRKGPAGSIHIVPSDEAGNVLPGWFMMGGNFASTSDSNFRDAVRELAGDACNIAVAIHDRQE